LLVRLGLTLRIEYGGGVESHKSAFVAGKDVASRPAQVATLLDEFPMRGHSRQHDQEIGKGADLEPVIGAAEGTGGSYATVGEDALGPCVVITRPGLGIPIQYFREPK
jgi:hypothetical protein